MAKKATKLLLDADVIIHFMKAGKQLVLPTIFPEYEMSILDKVFEELLKNLPQVNNLITFGTLNLLPFPSDNKDITKEYMLLLKQKKGKGESACLAFLRYNKDVLGSSNLKDIREYCEQYDIPYFTTMDFLCEAIKKEVLTEDECNDFVKTVLAKHSKLPCKTFYEYDCATRSVIDIDTIGQ
jgi:hypothetical protein